MIDPLNETTEITHEVVQTIIALAVKDIKGVVQVGAVGTLLIFR